MIVIPPIAPIPLPLAYAETHYRFRFLPSFLRKREPEIVFDAPHRVDPGMPVPVVLFAKDAHLFPAVLEHADATVRSEGREIYRAVVVHQPIRLSEEWWWTILDIDVPVQHTGWLEFDFRFSLRVGDAVRHYRANNYRTANGGPLRTYRSSTVLPSLPGFVHGEAHAHSSYTADQVEFGLPVRATRYLARSLGLGYLCITDHSYDLDDDPGSYLVNHAGLPKWAAFQEEVDALNADSSGPVVVRGEEVTVRNALGKNVHCLVYGDRAFHPGSGDSAERWLRTRSELSVDELASRVAERAAMFGAHVAEPVPLIQRLLLGRGAWSAEDIRHPRLDGIQFWNGERDEGMDRGLAHWMERLLSGARCVAVAGNDAHGNFNRFLQIRVPFLLLHDIDRQVFGRVRTAVYLTSIEEASVIGALRSGRSFMTDGPACAIYGDDGEPLNGARVPLSHGVSVRAASSAEFGSLASVRLLTGRRGDAVESVAARWEPAGDEFRSPYVTLSDDVDYVRAEAVTSRGDAYGRSHLALTNPVWGD